jgi:hypothetical protein
MTQQIQSIAIDNGYYSTICFKPPKTISFRSKYQESSIPLKYDNTHHLTINNTTYLVGDMAENIDITLDKSHSKLHYLTTLTALGLFGSGTYNLVANIPLNYFNRSNKEAFENYLTTSVEFLLNNSPCSINIPKVIVFPQSFPVLYCNKCPDYIGVADLGGLTCQGFISQKLNIIQSTIFSANLGTLILANKIKKQLNSIYNLNLQSYEIERIIKNGLPSKPESLSLIDSICTQHVEQIIKTIKLTGWNIQTTPILLTGGGSLLLEKYFSKILLIYQMSKNPVQDNVFGLYEVSKYVF